ncbi:zinc transporter 6-like [Diadema antillarum]|uniref:zinc transporter 6-like n=1 Tax=Diadema antillarum TaxID=105358 RepID=UPI003A845EBD
MQYGSQVIDIDAFDTSMDVDVGGRTHGFGKSLPAASSGHSHAHGHGHAHNSADHKYHGTVGHGVHGSASNGLGDIIHGTIQPFARPQHSFLTRLMTELRSVLKEQQAKRVVTLGIMGMLCFLVLLLWCQSTNSIALLAFTYIIFFDVLSLIVCLITIWVTKQKPSSIYTYGYERFEVLAVFSTTMLAIFGAIFIMKESTERILQPPEIHTGRLMLGAILGLFSHLVLLYGSSNQAFSHVSSASKSSWLQEHFADICRSFCTVVPGFDHLLLPRVNPFVLIGLCSMLSLCVTDFLVDMNNFHAADAVAAFCIAMMTIGTMFPMSVYSGTILLQTTPAHILGQLDKCLREASTLDGVLEFRNEHFWTMSFGQLVGSLNVRVRRDADEQMVLAHVYNKLSHLVSILTIQIIKDEWTRINPVSATIATTRSSLDDFTPSIPPIKPVASALPSYLGGGGSNFPMMPVRAHSTPFGTPIRDVSFASDIDSVPSHDVPSPIMPDARLKGILRTTTNSAYGAARPSLQFTSANLGPQRAPPTNAGSAVIDFSTLGTSNVLSSNAMKNTNARTSSRR